MKGVGELVKNMYKKNRNGKGRYQNGWIIMSGIVKSKRNIVSCMLGN